MLVELKEILEYEKPIDASLLPKDKWQANKFQENHLSSLYVRYLQIYHKIEVSFWLRAFEMEVVL